VVPAINNGAVTQASWASSPVRRRIMQSNKARDTKPELAVRRELHRAGLRYRVDVAPVAQLRRRADIVFPRRKVAVFIDGCFWHGCPDHGPTRFGTNPEYWMAKIDANRARDADTTETLTSAGWTVLRFWEHESPREVSVAIIAMMKPPSVVGDSA
jgi:DNA mismatch endonuclease (patch repair protein)